MHQLSIKEDNKAICIHQTLTKLGLPNEQCACHSFNNQLSGGTALYLCLLCSSHNSTTATK